MVDKKDDGSFLKKAAVGAPIAGAAGYGFYQMMQETQFAPRESPVQKAAETLSRMESMGTKSIDPRVHIQWMNRQSKFFAGEGAALAKTAWNQAVKNSDPLAQRALGSFAKTIGDLPEAHVASAITQVMAEQTSDLAQSVYRRFYKNVRVLREQEFASGIANFNFKSISGNFGPAVDDLVLEPGIMKRVETIEKALGAMPGSTHIKSLSRDPWIREGLGTFFMRFRAPSIKGDIKLMLPAISEEGILIEGLTQQTRRIAPSVGIFDPETGELRRMSRAEFYLEEFEKSILPDIETGRLKTRREVERAMNEMHRRVIQSLEAVPNVPASQQTAAGRIYERMRGKAMDIVIEQERYPGEGVWRYESAFRTPTETEMADAMAKHKLFAGVSPTGLARGRVMLEDISRYQLAPDALSWARRPEGAYRQYGLSQASQNLLAQVEGGRYLRYRQYETAAARGLEEGMVNPHLKAVYIDPSKYLGVMEKMEMGEGEALARRGLSDIIEFDSMRTKKLATVREDLQAALLAGEVPELKPGEVIGWSTEGDIITQQKNMRILRGVAHANDNEGTFMMLHYLDTRRMQSNDKLFGDLKAVTRMMNNRAFDRFVSDIAKNQRITEAADILISMDELRKDPAKHVRQMTTAFGEILESRQNVVNPALIAFQENPERFAQTMASATEGVYRHDMTIARMMNFAVNQADLTPKEFGAMFGAVPAVLGDEQEALNVMKVALRGENKAYAEEMLRGVAGGIAQITYGGPAEITGVGAMGSVEPRLFELLGSGRYGPQGAELSRDIARRVAYTAPEKRAVHETLADVLMSMKGQVSPPKGAEMWKAGQAGFAYNYDQFQAFIEKGGGWLDPGKGFKPIYVPGSETIKAMRPYQTIGGVTIHGDLAATFHQLARKSAQMYATENAIGTPEMQQEIAAAARGLQKHWAPAGKGMGSWMRGKVIGSRFLRGVSRAGGVGMNQLAEESANMMVAGIPKNVAKDMFQEMAESGLWNADRLSEMEARAMRGEEFGGLLVRHPIIGEFSAQQMRFKVLDMPGENIVLPERTVDLRVRRGQEIISKQVKLGPLVGLAGDKDADIFSAMLVSPDSEAAVRKATLAADSEFAQRYTQHQIRYQLLKAKSAGETLMSVQDKMIADARKLGTTQRWVPKLSVELSAAKRALGSFGKGQAAADAAMLLEWLEQTPISAKHMTAAQIKSGQLEGLLAEVTHSMQYGDAKGLERAVRNIVKDNAVATQLLTGNIRIDEGADQIAKLMGGKIQSDIKGVDISSATKTLMSSIEQYRLSGEARKAEVLASRGSGMSMREIPEVVAKQAAHMHGAMKGAFANVSRAATAASNAIGAVGRGIIKNHKTLGLGFAGALAVAAVLSDPPSTIGPGKGLIPQGVNLNVSKGANRLKPEDVMPPQQSLGNPTAPNMLQGRRAMISGAGPSQQVSVRARANYMVNTGDLAGRIGSLGGSNRSVNVNLRDNRSEINSHLAANKLL